MESLSVCVCVKYLKFYFKTILNNLFENAILCKRVTQERCEVFCETFQLASHFTYGLFSRANICKINVIRFELCFTPLLACV